MAVDHSPWGHLLARYRRPATADSPARVDYATFHAHPADRALLKSYIAHCAAQNIDSLETAAQFALWVNLYNALTIRLVLAHYPVTSIREIEGPPVKGVPGPWEIPLIRIGERELSLNDIEHRILRAQFRDPRVHFALNCASGSCPVIPPEPLTAEKLDAMLDEAARAFINSPDGLTFEDGTLTASRIFDWYRNDFGDSDAARREILKTYAEPALARALDETVSMSFRDYDWSLNAAGQDDKDD
ncbi:MAG: DUF547 domain-containing protein [Rhizobiales bacterium]|nr:DUF547 domain-containing protein [Hyphomicrobiales bacterium]